MSDDTEKWNAQWVQIWAQYRSGDHWFVMVYPDGTRKGTTYGALNEDPLREYYNVTPAAQKLFEFLERRNTLERITDNFLDTLLNDELEACVGLGCAKQWASTLESFSGDVPERVLFLDMLANATKAVFKKQAGQEQLGTNRAAVPLIRGRDRIPDKTIPGLFKLSGLDGRFPGYHNPERGYGDYAAPVFDLPTCVRILNAQLTENVEFSFTVSRDTITYSFNVSEGNITVPTIPEFELYALGTGVWEWEEITHD